jgi:hypothetical protein
MICTRRANVMGRHVCSPSASPRPPQTTQNSPSQARAPPPVAHHRQLGRDQREARRVPRRWRGVELRLGREEMTPSERARGEEQFARQCELIKSEPAGSLICLFSLVVDSNRRSRYTEHFQAHTVSSSRDMYG